MVCNFLVALPEANFPSEPPIFGCSRDYGFDFDEEELAEDLLAPLPALASTQPTRLAEADESGRISHCFFL
jgi:hypothetical protein